LQRHYLSLIEQSNPEIESSRENEFIVSIKQLIETELDNEQFGIPEICRSLGVSRSQLHRKLKALTGMSTSHFIRSIRLHQAKHFLLTTDLNIAQVAYEVGFKDPKYFSKTFAETYGIAPTDWRKAQ
jgi:AraC-like DNA-binding protein